MPKIYNAPLGFVLNPEGLVHELELELDRLRAACNLAATVLRDWKRDFPEAWGLGDQIALDQCAKAAKAVRA